MPLILAAVMATGLGALILSLSSWLGPKRPSKVKSEAFECGNPSSGTARGPFNARFYLVGILFLVFDIEAVFIYPWAITFHDSIKGIGSVPAGLALAEMGTFAAIFLVGLAYAWRKGALEWEPSSKGCAQPIHTKTSCITNIEQAHG